MSNLKEIVIISALIVFYFLAGKFGLSLAFANPSASPVWPPTGIALAAFLIWGYRIWPAIFIGAFFVNLTTAGTVMTSTGIALGNTLEGLLGAYLVNRFAEDGNAFAKPADIFKYTILAGMVSTLVSATIGVTSLAIGGFVDWTNYIAVWTTWWLGDMGGALIVAPALLLWNAHHKLSWNFALVAEALTASFALFLITQVLFLTALPLTIQTYPLAFITIPVLVWIAFRFGPRETATALLILSGIAIFGTLNGLGPFVKEDPNQSLLMLQVYMGIIFLAVMPLAAAVYQQKKVEESLRESEERYRKFIETSPDAIVVTDLAANIQVVDEQTLALYGLQNKEEMIGKSGFAFVAPEDLEKTKQALSEVLKKGRITNMEYTSVRPDGSHFIASVNASLLLNSKGKPQSIIVIVHDVTKEKEIDRAKTEFVSLASHQLRTPLSILNWYAERLLKHSSIAMEKQKQYLEALYQTSQRMTRLVNSLLSVSRIDLGTFSISPKQVNISKIAKSILLELEPQIDAKKIKIIEEFTDGVPQIQADPELLRIIFQNLLSNAINYTSDAGTITLEISSTDHNIVIKVADTGWGIPQEAKPKIFTKLFRADNVKSRDVEGTGLGLYTVKSIIEQAGGNIRFESQENKGTTFYVTIPLKGVKKKEGSRQLSNE